MTTYNLLVTCGKRQVKTNVSSNEKVSTLRNNVEQELGFVEGGIRFIFKGKSLSDGMIIQSCGIQDGAKLMALRTPKQLSAERDQEKQIKLQQILSAKSSADGSSSISNAVKPDSSDQKVKIFGDDEVEGMDFVMVRRGRDKYRVNGTINVSDLKQRIAGMIGASNWKEIRLLGGGKFLRDDDVTKSGSTLVMLFTARHHDRVEEGVELKKLLDETDQVEKRIEALKKQAAHRLKDREDLVIEMSQINQDVRRLRDNLGLIREGGETKAQLEKRLGSLDTDFI